MSGKENRDDGYAQLKETLSKSYKSEEIALFDKAYAFANQAHGGQLRYSGEFFISHPVAVALILAQLGMDSASIIAALLHDTVEDTSVSIEEVKSDFGDEIAYLVDGVTKLGKVPLSTKEEEQAENIRKMLLAMSQDIRVIIIKLADRMHNMRTLVFMDPQKRRDKSLETLEIYAPIAHRLGIRTLKEELEDLAIGYLDPIGYQEIEQSLETQSQSRKEFLEEIKSQINERIVKIVPDVIVDGRIKRVHGIYRKMYMQNREFNEIYDIYAVRIIVETEMDCYNCLGFIHDMYHPIPGRFKDYISTPKPNLYQSLHTTVISNEGIPFEVQIRTKEMHQTAEYGIAAHWKYKLGLGGSAKFEERLSWLMQLLESQKDSEDVEEIVRTIKSDLVPEEVFVFTPKGDVINLPSGATVIDFAYAIHSAVGNRMVGAKVDGRIVSLEYQVKSGEIIEVQTSQQKGKGPSKDWLKIVKTSEARNKIRSWFKKERREENIVEGKIDVEREFKRNYIQLTDEEYQEFIKKIADRQHCNTVDDFYASIGYGGISINRMMPRIKDDYLKTYKSRGEQEVVITPEDKRPRSSEGVIVEGIENCLVKLSKCCNPLPGDEIIGFITRGHGVSIHKRDCNNVPKSVSTSSEPDRWLNASWDRNVREEFKSKLLISCLNRVGMLADITGQLAGMSVMINDVNTRHSKDGRSTFIMTITVNSVEHMKSVISKLEKVKGVLSVERAGV